MFTPIPAKERLQLPKKIKNENGKAGDIFKGHQKTILYGEKIILENGFLNTNFEKNSSNHFSFSNLQKTKAISRKWRQTPQIHEFQCIWSQCSQLPNYRTSHNTKSQEPSNFMQITFFFVKQNTWTGQQEGAFRENRLATSHHGCPYINVQITFHYREQTKQSYSYQILYMFNKETILIKSKYNTKCLKPKRNLLRFPVTKALSLNAETKWIRKFLFFFSFT